MGEMRIEQGDTLNIVQQKHLANPSHSRRGNPSLDGLVGATRNLPTTSTTRPLSKIQDWGRFPSPLR